MQGDLDSRPRPSRGLLDGSGRCCCIRVAERTGLAWRVCVVRFCGGHCVGCGSSLTPCRGNGGVFFGFQQSVGLLCASTAKSVLSYRCITDCRILQYIYLRFSTVLCVRLAYSMHAHPVRCLLRRRTRPLVPSSPSCRSVSRRLSIYPSLRRWVPCHVWAG